MKSIFKILLAKSHSTNSIYTLHTEFRTKRKRYSKGSSPLENETFLHMTISLEEKSEQDTQRTDYNKLIKQVQSYYLSEKNNPSKFQFPTDSLVTFNINKGLFPLLVVSVNKSILQPEEDIRVTLDLSGALLRCFQVSARLEMQEVFEESLVVAHRKKKPLISQIFAEHHEIVQNCKLTSFSFSLPRDATPSFQTDCVNIEWVLDFEFIVNKYDNATWQQKHSALSKQGMEEVNINGPFETEVLRWKLPFQVIPSLPSDSYREETRKIFQIKL
jgi:hypothetical protein